MEKLFESINMFFEFIVPITDFLWGFPTNYEWYSNIPILGKFTLANLLLMGGGIYFTIKTRFVQFREFKTGIKILATKKSSEQGVTPLAAFLLSSAMRVGPGNIMGVTGAISVGGPGALFWMWITALLGMATAFGEAVLAQVFKEKEGKDYVGGLPFYGMKIFGGRRWVGNLLSIIFIIYALFGTPGQVFHVFTALGSVADNIAGTTLGRQSPVYYAIGISLVLSVAMVIFGGIRRVTKVTDVMVPIMAAIYVIIALSLLVINFRMLPYCFMEIFKGAFTPSAMFGGAFGVVLAQGVKRGLMSNEAGQGTITMAAAVAENDHPAEQGFVQSIGVFLDTMIICTLTGLLIVMAHIWTGDSGVVWESIVDSKITIYISSINYLVPGESMDVFINSIMSICYALFAYTTMLGLISFAEISACFISRSKKFIKFIRISGALVFVPFGALTVLSGLELGNLWYISDFVNIMVVYANVPTLFAGSTIVFKVLEHYNNCKGSNFYGEDIGLDTELWRRAG